MMRRLQSSFGQGLVEMVVVVVLFGAAVAAAVPTYLGMQGRKADKTAKQHLVAAVPMANAFRQDHGSYRGMDAIDLLQIDPRVAATLTVAFADRHAYCLTDTVHGKTWSLRGPYRGDARFSANANCS